MKKLLLAIPLLFSAADEEVCNNHCAPQLQEERADILTGALSWRPLPGGITTRISTTGCAPGESGSVGVEIRFELVNPDTSCGYVPVLVPCDERDCWGEWELKYRYTVAGGSTAMLDDANPRGTLVVGQCRVEYEWLTAGAAAGDWITACTGSWRDTCGYSEKLTVHRSTTMSACGGPSVTFAASNLYHIYCGRCR